MTFLEGKCFCISAQTEAERPRGERQHHTELEEAVRWKSLPQGREEEQEEDN